MLVREWMTTVLVTVRPDAPVAEAQHLMRHRRIRHLPVVEGGRLAGIITDRDVRTTLPSPATSLAAGEIRYLLDRLLVERVMTRSVITIGPDAPIAEAVRLVLAHRIGALPVTENTRVVGIITETDLLRAFATMFAAAAATPARDAAPAAPPAIPAPRGAGHTILVPLDGAAGSESVLPTVGELAQARGARVRLLRVAPEPKAVEADHRIIAYADQETSRVEMEALAYLKRVALALPGIEVDCAVCFGEAAEEIVKAARAAHADLIAMATHRRRGLDRALRGSVAETVERASAIPVVLVPYGPEPAAE
jgi:CBS domain-containing protein/nucleotide-binding universal stress UspA family protein